MEHVAAGVRPLSYPALLLFAGLSTGVVVDTWLMNLPPTAWALSAMLAVLGASLAMWYGRRRFVSPTRIILFASFALVAISLGGLRHSQFLAIPPDHVSKLISPGSERQIRLLGRLAAAPTLRNQRLRFILEVSHVHLGGGETFRPARGTVYVTARIEGVPAAMEHLRRGARLEAMGELAATYPRRNPADFDFRRYLRMRGVSALLNVATEADLRVLAPPRAIVERIAALVQQRIERALDHHIETDAGRAVLSALLLGRKQEIDPESLEAFSRTGLMHVLAVSGLHVLMVGMIVYGLLGPSLLRFRLSWRSVEIIRATITLSLLVIYAIVTGASASVTRAVVMTSVLIGGAVLQRSAPPLNSLGFAGCVLLLMKPTFLLDVGFQLSFTAVAAIVSLHAPLNRVQQDRWDHDSWQAKAWRSISATIAATLGTAPVLLYHFGRVAAAGLVLNPIAVPLTGLSLGGGLLTVLAQEVEFLGASFGAAADVLAQALLSTASVGEALLGWATIEGRLTYLPFTAALSVFICAIAAWLRPRMRWRLVIVASALFAAGTWGRAVAPEARKALELIAFDVGQGDAMLLSFPGGKKVLVDCGPRTMFSDAADRVLLPHLQRFEIAALDAVVLSHPHSDHIGGLPQLLRTVPVHRIIHNGENYDSHLYREINALAEELDIPSHSVHAGDTLDFDPNVRVYVIAPDPHSPASSNANDRSLALRLSYGSIDALLMGDAETPTEHSLTLGIGHALASEIIKAGHHGSNTSSTVPFVEAATYGVENALVLISVGRRNRFGHPDPHVLDRWLSVGADVHLTSEGGAVWLRSDGSDVRIVPWRVRY